MILRNKLEILNEKKNLQDGFHVGKSQKNAERFRLKLRDKCNGYLHDIFYIR